LRVAHISSHLIDGFSKDGVFFKMPFVYSREFVELFITKYVELSDRLVLRPHIGFTGVFSTAPDDIAPLIGRVGFDLNYNLNQHIEFLVGTSVSNGEIDANISTQIGVNLRFIQNTGLFIGYYNYYGSSIHGMFYKNRDNYSAIGFQIIYN